MLPTSCSPKVQLVPFECAWVWSHLLEHGEYTNGHLSDLWNSCLLLVFSCLFSIQLHYGIFKTKFALHWFFSLFLSYCILLYILFLNLIYQREYPKLTSLNMTSNSNHFCLQSLFHFPLWLIKTLVCINTISSVFIHSLPDT